MVSNDVGDLYWRLILAMAYPVAVTLRHWTGATQTNATLISGNHVDGCNLASTIRHAACASNDRLQRTFRECGA